MKFKKFQKLRKFKIIKLNFLPSFRDKFQKSKKFQNFEIFINFKIYEFKKLLQQF